jgi:hypothetical protein
MSQDEINNNVVVQVKPESEPVPESKPVPVKSFTPCSYAEAIVGDKIVVSEVPPPTNDTVATDDKVETPPTDVKPSTSKNNRTKPRVTRPRNTKRNSGSSNSAYQHAYETALHWLVEECTLPKADVNEMVEDTRYVIDSKTRQPTRSLRVVTLPCEGDRDNIDSAERHVSRKERLAQRESRPRQPKVKPNIKGGSDSSKDDSDSSKPNVGLSSPTDTINTDDLLKKSHATERTTTEFTFQKSRFWTSKAFKQQIINYYRPLGYYVKIYTYQGGRRAAIDISW